MDTFLIAHCERVAEYTQLLYQLCLENSLFPDQLFEEALYHIKQAVIYHDIGKSVFNSRFLNRKLSLTTSEERWLEHHVNFGLLIFQKTCSYPFSTYHSKLYLDIVSAAIGQHHERYDGKGYPNGLKGDEISPIGQICGICDYYDIVSSPPLGNNSFFRHDEAIYMIEQEREKHFNPVLVDIFIENKEAFKKIKDKNIY
nr:HD domain-containing phosphohydrolase [Clostridium cadaveris]